MTNKKFKVAAMSMALTACVAAQPLIANAADDVDTVEKNNDTSAEQTQNAETSTQSETPTENKQKYCIAFVLMIVRYLLVKRGVNSTNKMINPENLSGIL